MNALELLIDDHNSNKEEHNLVIKDSPRNNLRKLLKERRFKEFEALRKKWIEEGKNGREPSRITPIRCSKILEEYISFCLFDLEENARLAMYMAKEGIYTQNETLIRRIISWLEPQLNSRSAGDVIYYLRNSAEIKERTVSRYLIPVKNGVFNLKEKRLDPFSPDYVFTTKISTPYKENISNPVLDGWDVETWLDSIACGDKELVQLFWQVINDALNGNYSRKKAIFLVGGGNNGKGTFQEFLTNLLGFENIATLKVNEFDERFRLSMIEGKTAVIGDDVPANVYIDDSSNFNSVVTGDIVAVERKGKDPYSTIFRTSVIQSTNGMPKFKNKTDGTLRRVLIVPFNANFNGKTENLKIKDEYIKKPKVLEYTLHKAINMDFEKFDTPKASSIELESFKQDNDPIFDFKVSEFDRWGIQEVPKKLVYEIYKHFCSENQFRPLSNRSFHGQFKKHLDSSWTDGQKRFKYDELLPHLGDLDEIGIGFPDESVPLGTYKKM